jgi:hypothetical protein
MMQELSRHVYLTVLHVGWPKLAYQITDAAVSVAKDGNQLEIAEEFRNNPQWTLLPQSWHDRFATIEGRARRTMAAAALPFATKGMALLPIARAAEVFGALRELRDDMFTNRDSFVQDYGNILRNLRERLGPELFALAAKKLPTASTMSTKFQMVWAIMPVGGARPYATIAELEGMESVMQRVVAMLRGDEQLIASDVAPTLELVQRMLNTARNPVEVVDDDTALDLIREARQQTHRLTEQMVESMAAEPRQVVADAVNNMLEAIQTGRVVRTGTINQCQRAFELLRGFSFLADAELLQRIRQCEVALGSTTPHEINSDGVVGARLANVLRGVVEQANNPAAVQRAVREFRTVSSVDQSSF